MQLAWDSERRKKLEAGEYVRERSADPYHTYRWTKLSAAFRRETGHILCEECARQGRPATPADVVDHITPWPICGIDGFFDRRNLQSLCSRCNIEKGNRDKKLISEWRKIHKEP